MTIIDDEKIGEGQSDDTYKAENWVFFFFLVFLSFLGPLPRHMKVPRLGV